MGMPSLPDVDQQSYDDYQGQKFQDYATNQIEGFGFEHAANALISGLGNFKDQLTSPPTPPPPTPPEPQPEAPSPPEVPPAVALGPATPPPVAVPSPSQDQAQPAGGGQPTVALGPAVAPSAPSVPADQSGAALMTAPPGNAAGQSLSHPDAQSTQGGPSGQQWLDVAQAQLNKPYIWGSAGGRTDMGQNPAGFDCSGFVSYVMKTGFGVDLPAFTGTAYQQTRPLGPNEQPRPGDVVFYNMNQADPHQQHIALYIGNGQIIQAGGTQDDVNVTTANQNVGSPPEYRRPTGLDNERGNQLAQITVGSTAQQATSPTTPVTAPLQNPDQATQRGLPNPQQMADYIRYAAAQRGIDPDVAVRVASSEGLNHSYTGDQGSSFGPFQLHMGGIAPAGSGNEGAGMGDSFVKATGLDPRDPSTWQQQVDYSLDQAARGGWGPWHGAPLVGVGPRDGIGSFKGDVNQYVQGAQDALDAAKQAVGSAASGLGTAVRGALDTAGQTIGGAAYSLGNTAQDLLGNLTGPQRPAYSLSSLEDLLSSGNPLGAAGQAAYSLGSDLGTQANAGLQDQIRQLQDQVQQRNPLQTLGTAADTLGTSASSLLGNAIDTYQPLADTLGQRARDTFDYLNTPQSVLDLTQNGPMPAVRQALQTVGQGLTGGQTYDLGDVLNAPYTARMAAGQALENVPTGEVPVLSGLASLGAQRVGSFLQQPSAVDAAQTLGTLVQKYPNMDAAQMTPEDRQAFEQAFVTVGGIESPETPKALTNLARGLPSAVGNMVQSAQERFLQAVGDASELRTTPAGPNDVALTAAQVEQHARGLADLAARLDEQAGTLADTAPQRAESLQQQAQVVRDAQQQIQTAPPDTSFYMPRPSTAEDVRPSSVADVRQAVPAEVRNGQQQVQIERLAEPTTEPAVPNGRLAHTAMPEDQTATPTVPALQDLAEPRPRVQPLSPAVERAAQTARQTDGPVPSVMPEGAIGVVPPKPASTASLATRIVRQITDKNVDLNQLQDLAEKNAANEGRTLGPDEMAAYLARAQSEPAAQVRVQKLQGIARDVGIDVGHLDDLLKLRSNLQVSAAIGERVTGERLAADTPAHLADELRAANSSLNMRQRQLDLAQANEIPEADRISAAQRALKASQRRVDRAQKRIDDWQQANQAAAGQAGQKAAAQRMFAGGMNAADSAAAINQMREQLGPARFAKVEHAADQVSEYTRDLRNRLVTSQVFSPEMAAEFERRYPDWIKTEVIRYMNDDTAAGMASGEKLGLSDNKVRAYTEAGSDQAVHSPLLSIEKYTYQVEKMAMKNEAALAFKKIAGGDLREIPTSYTLDPKNETAINLFQNGTKKRYLTTNKWVGETINGAGVADVPEWAKAWTDLFRMFATGRNPLFLSANAINDAAEYLIRTSAAEGGPHHALGIMGTLFKTYGDTFKGLLTGEFHGPMTQAYLERGGGVGGGTYYRALQAGSAGGHEQALSRLAGGPLVDLSSPQGIKNFVTSFLKFRWVEHVGERIELAPHVAAYSRALGRGENEVRAMIRGRDVTLDFARGGAAVKYVNNFIPFFNASVQGSAQLVRMARDNPVAATSTLVTLIGVPTALAELWDRGYNPDGSYDDQRAQDYQDVPQYEKDRGVVVMLPGEAPTDAQGNRRPNYVTVNLRNFAAFSTLARDVTARALGDESRGLGDTFQSARYAAVPQTDPAQLVGSIIRSVPGLSSAAQLEMNRDLYRNRYIVSNRADQNASAVAKAAASAAQPVADALTGGTTQIRPSAIDFAIQNEGAGLGSSILGGGTLAARGIRSGVNTVTGQDEPLPEDTLATGVGGVPLVGGLAGRFVRNQTGQLLQTEGEESLTPSARSALRASGVTYTPGPVANSIQNVPLLQSEQVQYQRLANRYVDDEIQRLVRTGNWERLPVDERDRLAQQAVQRGRLKAAQDVMRTISPARRQAVARARLPVGAA